MENLELYLSNVSLKESDSHQCNVCGGGFISKGYLDQHLAKKHDIALKPHKCDECDKILQSKRNLTEHIKKVHRSCKTCALAFSSKADTDEHNLQGLQCGYENQL